MNRVKEYLGEPVSRGRALLVVLILGVFGWVWVSGPEAWPVGDGIVEARPYTCLVEAPQPATGGRTWQDMECAPVDWVCRNPRPGKGPGVTDCDPARNEDH